MTRKLSVVETKRDFKTVLDAAERGESTVVLRHGKPAAVIVPVESVRDSQLPAPQKPGGLLAAMGLLAEWDTIVEDMAEIIASRAEARDRPPPDFD
jgi:prevent-host-death family protein